MARIFRNGDCKRNSLDYELEESLRKIEKEKKAEQSKNSTHDIVIPYLMIMVMIRTVLRNGGLQYSVNSKFMFEKDGKHCSYI
jgi:hypothetical protein